MRKMIRYDVCHKPVNEINVLPIDGTPSLSWIETNQIPQRGNAKIWYRRGEINK